VRPEERSLFLRHHVGQQTFVELAKETGSTPDAVRMAVKRTGKKMAVYLLGRDFDANGYLAILASTPPPQLGLHRISTGEE